MMNKFEIHTFLKSKGLEMIDSDKSDYFNDYYEVFSEGILAIRFSGSKSNESIDFNNVRESGKWYDLGIEKDYLKNTQNLVKVISIEESCIFLKNEFDHIKVVFGKDYLKNKNNLDILERKRAELMFPGRLS